LLLLAVPGRYSPSLLAVPGCYLSLAAVEKPGFPEPRPYDWLFLCGINSGISEVSEDWLTKAADRRG
jgi:hypothetical protein